MALVHVTGFLASYWYYKRRDFSGWPGPLILDSGAFSAYTQGESVDIDELATFYQRVRAETAPGVLQWAVTLDVLGDHEASFKNWELLEGWGVPTVPVVHFTSPVPIEEQLAPYLGAGVTRVCFGGMVGAIDEVNRWAAHGLRHLRDTRPDVLVHGLGVGPWVVRARLPWDSTDCSDFGLAYRFGYARLPNPAARKPIDIRLGTGYPPSRSAAAVIRRYGIEPRDCTSPEPPTRCTALARLSFRASEDEEAMENERRLKASLASPGAPGSFRPVTRYVVDGNPYAEPVIFEEMRKTAREGRYRPARVPGVVKPVQGTRVARRT